MTLPKVSTKRKATTKQTEDQLQRSVARLLDYSGLLWCHVPNGGQRNAIVGAKLKAQGVKRGVPDVMVFHPAHNTADEVDRHLDELRGQLSVGLAIELKVEGKPSLEQFAWHDRLRANGWRVEVCYTLDEVKKIVRQCYPNCKIL